jgi:hypothetical protein
MHIEELREQLQEMGVNVSEKTLRRWGDNGIIENHRRNLPHTGRGNAEDWPEEALEEAAAAWAVFNYEKGVRVTPKMVKVVKQAVSYVYSGAFPSYEIPPIFRSPQGITEVSYQAIRMQFAPEAIGMPDGSDAISLFPGLKKEDRVKFLDDLVIKWIATIAKVSFTRKQELWARKARESSHYVWPLDQGATVLLEYRRTFLEGARDQHGQPVTVPYTQLNRITAASKSDNGDDVIFINENGIDTRILLAHNIRFYTPGCMTVQNTQPNQTAQFTSAINFTAKSIQSPQKFGVATLEPGYKYVMYKVALRNANARDRQVHALFFTLLDANDNVYYVDSLVQGRYLSQAFPLNFRVTQPGDKVTGRIVFEVPQNATPIALNYEDHLVAYDYKVNNVTVRL